MSASRPASAVSLPLAWLAAALLIGLGDWVSVSTAAAQQSNGVDAFYVQQHLGLTISLAAAFAVFGATYFAIGRKAGCRFPWHIAWGQFVLSFAGVLLMEAPALALSRIGLQDADFPTAFRFWNNVSAAGYLTVLAGLLLFAYLAFTGLRPRKSARG